MGHSMTTQSLAAYWQRLTHRISDEADGTEAPVLDLAGCFGTPAMRALPAASVVARLGHPSAAARPDGR